MEGKIAKFRLDNDGDEIAALRLVCPAKLEP
jgi:hypothetical protein